MAHRAILFIDGNNWYHGLKSLGITEQGRLDYGKISTKVVRHRDWISTRYYVGRVPQVGDVTLYAEQRRSSQSWNRILKSAHTWGGSSSDGVSTSSRGNYGHTSPASTRESRVCQT